jgi:IclR family pca regulon transcriptional regulator
MAQAKRGPHTITTRRALREELESVGSEGFATNDEELAPELVSIAVPVRTENGEVSAAINMAAHTSMISLDALVEELLPQLLTTADQISARLGFRRDDDASR